MGTVIRPLFLVRETGNAMRFLAVVVLSWMLVGCSGTPVSGDSPPATASERTSPSQPIRAVWLLATQPCNGNFANTMKRHPQEVEIMRSGEVVLNNLGIRFRVPFVPKVENFVVKLFLNDKSRGVVDHYILIADEDLEPPFGGVVITELPASHANHQAAFGSAYLLQQRNAGEAYASIRKREFNDVAFGKTLEFITPKRAGSHCFPTSTYKFLPNDQKLTSVGISRFILKDNKLVEIAFIVPVSADLPWSQRESYARSEMDKYWRGLSLTTN
jgi:hypothetical protein